MTTWLDFPKDCSPRELEVVSCVLSTNNISIQYPISFCRQMISRRHFPLSIATVHSTVYNFRINLLENMWFETCVVNTKCISNERDCVGYTNVNTLLAVTEVVPLSKEIFRFHSPIQYLYFQSSLVTFIFPFSLNILPRSFYIRQSLFNLFHLHVDIFFLHSFILILNFVFNVFQLWTKLVETQETYNKSLRIELTR